MRTAKAIESDMAKIEALMKLGSAREIAQLSKLMELCQAALKIIDTANPDFLAKQKEAASDKYSKYLKQREIVAKIEHKEYRDEKQKEVEKQFKPDTLKHQIKFLNYILGDVELVDQDLLNSFKGVSATGKHAAKVNPV